MRESGSELDSKVNQRLSPEDMQLELDHIASLFLRISVFDSQFHSNKLIGLNILPLHALREGFRFVPIFVFSGKLKNQSGILCRFDFQ
ncbi:MAG: hypothetical protein EZS28_001105 [Streblomastix strix]|nr:MAG: hypothetical protein EZS28_001105 [Streblomastix strix]